jgi:tetratricopeptide (TPR) repeat protein
MGLRNQFWEVMKSNCDGRNFQALDCIPKEILNNKFQLFEVLVVESLNRLDSALEWTVTQVRGDMGVDFRGAGPQREIGILNLKIGQTLIGQTKRRADRSLKLFDDDLKKVGRLALSENISGVVFVFSSESITSEALYEYFRQPDNSIHFRGAKYFVDARRFEEFWARDLAHVMKILERCLNEGQRQIVEDYLSSIAYTSQTKLDVELNQDSIGMTGKRFRCYLRISQPLPLPNLRVRLRYQVDPQETTKIEVLLPSRLAGQGHEIVLSGEGVSEFEFFLRCFVAGKRRLGKIQIESESGVLIDSVDLGEREFLRTFEPPYFNKPNRTLHRIATLRLAAAANGEIHALTLLGAGGAGKSRFGDAILEEAADLGFDWLSIGHDNSVQARRRLLRELITSLIPGRTDGSRFERTLHWLQGRLSPFDEARQLALKTFFEAESESVANEVVTAALLALIVERTKYKPLFIHLRDLHWADGETLSILGNTIEAAQGAGPMAHGALFILEGRDRDSLRLQTGLYRPPEDWLAFLKARGYEQFEIPIWTASQSEEFLRDMIVAVSDPSQGVLPQRLPMFEQLCEHLLSAGSGNPMHIIEQIKFLIDRDYIEVTDAGTIYLRHNIPTDWQPAQTIEELIRLRLEFLKTRSPLAAELLIVMAKIGPRVSGALFRFVVNSAGDRQSAPAALYGVDMAVIPKHSGESLAFRHENYYQVCRQSVIRGDAPYLGAAIAFYQSQQSLTAKQEFELAFLMAHQERPDYSRMIGHVTHAMEESKEFGDNLLFMDLCKFFLNLPENIIRKSGVDSAELRFEQGVRQIFSGNWEESLKSLREAESIFSRRPRSEGIITRRAFCRIEIADSLVALMRTDEALAETDSGVRLIDECLSLENQGGHSKLTEARDRLWLRRAVAYWFDGNFSEAAKWHRRAYVSGRKQQNAVTVGEALREFGTLLLHRNPRFGRRVLSWALEQLKQEGEHQASILTHVELLFADLMLATWVDKDFSRIAQIREQAISLHYVCQEKASLYEAALLSLVAGSCCAIDRQLEDAHHWFRLAITTAVRTSAYEEVWKGRLNLGQLCLELESPAEARLHVAEAVETMLIGLDAGKWINRSARRAMLTWPLLQCLRVAPEMQDRLSAYLTCDADLARKHWQQRPPAVSKTKRLAQVLHVRAGDSDYYLHT